MKTIVFYSNQLSLRGTEIALYSYADYNEKILNNKSIIMSSFHNNLDALPKFKNRFETILTEPYDYDRKLLKLGADYFYVIKSGKNDRLMSRVIPTLVHCVFRYNEPHGDKYVYISDWLAKNQGYNPETHSVPNIVEKFPVDSYDLREKLGISKDKRVFGCYGGRDQFNIEIARRVVGKVATERNDIVFLFMNINKFSDNQNIIFLDGTYDLREKAALVRACDAMLHARQIGETFGMAIAEFSMENKPVLTFPYAKDACHIEILGDHGLYYCNEDELYDMIVNLPNYIKFDDYSELYKVFSPEIIMEKFNRIFLQ